MRITLTTPEGDRARYVFTSADIEVTSFAPYPPQAGELRTLFEVAGAEAIEVEPYAPPVPPVPEEISDRQFFQQLAVEEIISPAEALAAVKTGEVPSKLLTFLEALPPDARFGAEMLISGATTFRRSHPLSETIRIALGWTPERLADFWRSAAAL